MKRLDLFDLSNRAPLRPEVWELRYRTRAGVRAYASIRLHVNELRAQVRRGREVVEMTSTAPHKPLVLGTFLDPHDDHITAPFRRVR